MKRNILIGTIATAIILGGAFAVGASNNEGGSSSAINPANNNKNGNIMLTADEAKKIALKEVNGVVDSVELENEHNKVQYDVDIVKDGVEYEIDLDAYTGEVYSVRQDDKDNDKYDDSHDDDDGKYDDKYDDNPTGKVNSSTKVVTTTHTSNQTISQADAVQIAENEVNGKMYEVDLDNDDGVTLYEVELKTDQGKAEVDVDASTGNVIKVEFDDQNNDDDHYDD